MECLPQSVVHKITDYLKLEEYKNVQKCSKYLNTTIKHLYQNENEINLLSIQKSNIDELYQLLKYQLEFISKNKNSFCSEIQYDIEWAISRFHCERNKIIHGLTKEQQQIINFKASHGNVILIQAFAGTGKTTTLLNIAKHNYDKQVLYLTFNKSLVESAKNSSNIPNMKICTMHSLALNAIDPDKKLNIGKLTLTYIENTFTIDRQEASIINKILNNFYSSNSKKISSTHCSLLNLNNEDEYIENALVIWNKILKNECKVPHDAYLKIYQLQNLKLNFDIIMLDEAQDSTECMLTILRKQSHTIRYLVGDIHQQIYGFRNVVNPFHNDDNDIIKFTLSQSFRYGYQISHLANMFLKEFKNESKKIFSTQLSTNILTSVRDLKDEPYTLITRTNVKLLKEAFELERTKSIFIIGKEYNFTKECRYVEYLDLIQSGLEVDIPKLKGFSNIEQVKNHFQLLGNHKWIMRINLFLEYGKDALDNNYKELDRKMVNNENDADVILSTVHQSKGLEFNNVKLSNDFIPLVTTLNTIYAYKSRSALEDYNILYVALTRGKKNLILNKELYCYLKIKKGQRVYISNDGICKTCNQDVLLKKYEEGINCIGFNSKLLYSVKHSCGCFS